MSARSSITNALVEKLKLIDGTSPYITNIFNNAYAQHRFWTEVTDFPCIYVVPGAETREYLPAGFTWTYLNISLKVYVKGEEPLAELEDLLEDIERVINANRVLAYDTNKETTEILINSIVTDEGLLLPFAIAEVSLTVRHQAIQ